jgi:hypothetical protein
MKPANWPSYMIEKRLRSGVVAYYWNPPIRDLEDGFTLNREPLGQDFSAACERADVLNKHLLSWRAGRNSDKTLDLQPGYGTLDWLVERYYRSRAFEKLTPRSQPNYRHAFKIVLDIELKDGRRAGALRLGQVSAAFADKVYAKVLLRGPRQAALCIALMRRAWKVVHRLHHKAVPLSNPWVGVIQAKGVAEEIVPASRDEAFALVEEAQRLAANRSAGVGQTFAERTHGQGSHEMLDREVLLPKFEGFAQDFFRFIGSIEFAENQALNGKCGGETDVFGIGVLAIVLQDLVDFSLRFRVPPTARQDDTRLKVGIVIVRVGCQLLPEGGESGIRIAREE